MEEYRIHSLRHLGSWPLIHFKAMMMMGGKPLRSPKLRQLISILMMINTLLCIHAANSWWCPLAAKEAVETRLLATSQELDRDWSSHGDHTWKFSSLIYTYITHVYYALTHTDELGCGYLSKGGGGPFSWSLMSKWWWWWWCRFDLIPCVLILVVFLFDSSFHKRFTEWVKKVTGKLVMR